MATVDSLDIQISASFRTAASAIDDLNTRLGRTATSLSSIGTNLQRQLSPMTSATRSLNQAFNSGNTLIGKVKKSSESLSSSLTKLYAKYSILKRAIKAFGNSIKESADYIESFNYFNVAMGKVADEWKDSFAEYGYDNADSYAESFSGRLNELFGKMSNVTLNIDTGTLQSNMSKNLGINLTQLTQYASNMAAVTNSMKMTGEATVAVSKAMSMLAVDMSSLKNTTLQEAMNSFSSGLIGQSRALYKYGIDITNATLQQYAYNLGIEKSITAMTQGEKAQLRMIAILDQSKVAWGDQAKTINTISNQFRMFKSNVSSVGTLIGQLFVPIISKVIPYINGFVIALQRLFTSIAGAVGIKINLDDFSQGYSTLGEQLEDTADSYNEATASAKKYKNQLLGFDEVYKLSEPADDTSNAGAGDMIDLTDEISRALADYEAVWNEAFNDMSNKANEIADRITNAFKSGDYKGIGRYISTNISDALASINWDSVYQAANNFGTGLAQFLNGLITPDLFGNVGKTIAGFLNTKIYAALSFGQEFSFVNLGESIAAGVNNFFATFDFGSLAETINVWAKGILSTTITAFDNTDWGMIGEQIGTFLAEIDLFEIGFKAGESLWKGINSGLKMWAGSFSKAPFETAFLSILALPAIVGFGSKLAGLIVTPFKNVWNLLSPIIAPLVSSVGEMFSLWIGGAGTFGESFMAVFGAGGVVVVALAALAAGLGYVFATNEDVRESFNNAISSIKEGLQPALEFFTGTLLPDLQAGWERILEVLSPLGEFLEGMFTSVWQDMINPALTYIGETVLPKVTETFENLWNKVLVPLGSFLADVLEPVIQVVADVLSILWKNRVLPLANAIGNVFSKAFEGLCSVLNNLVIPVVNAIINVFQFLWNNVLSPIVNFVKNVFEPVFESKFEGIKGIINGLSKAFGGLIDFVTGVFSGEWSRAWEGVKNIFSGIWDTLVSKAKAPLNGVLSLFQGLANGIIDAWNFVKRQLNKISIDIPDWVPGVGGEKFGFDFDMSSHISLPKLAKGAVIKGGNPFMAILGDQPKGKTNIEAPLDTIRQAVQMELDNVGGYGRYGEDYLQQMKQAAYEGVLQAIRDAGGIRAEATFRVEGDPKGLFNVIRDEAFNYARQTYTSPFPT